MSNFTFEREAARDVERDGTIERWTRVRAFVNGTEVAALDWSEDVPDDMIGAQLDRELRRRGLIPR
jgi:hypothetical protein